MNKEDDILIDDFLHGLLSEDELNEFYKRMADDLEFKKKVALEQQVFESLNEESWNFISDKDSAEVKSLTDSFRSEEIQQLKQKIALESKTYHKREKNRINRLLFISAAATIALLIAFNFIFNTMNSQSLYNSYMDFDELPSFTTRNSTDDSNLIKAKQFFDGKDFDKSLNLFEQELRNPTTNKGSIYLYMGILQIELKKYEEAEMTFNDLIGSDLIDAQKGYWYKALLYLKQDEPAKAKLLLEEIIKNSYFNHQKAKKLVAEID